MHTHTHTYTHLALDDLSRIEHHHSTERLKQLTSPATPLQLSGSTTARTRSALSRPTMDASLRSLSRRPACSFQQPPSQTRINRLPLVGELQPISQPHEDDCPPRTAYAGDITSSIDEATIAGCLQWQNRRLWLACRPARPFFSTVFCDRSFFIPKPSIP